MLRRPLLDISVTENGFAVKDENTMALEDALKDDPRVHYYQGVTESLINAIVEDGVDIRAYFAWSECQPLSRISIRVLAPKLTRCRSGLLDNFEWYAVYFWTTACLRMPE